MYFIITKVAADSVAESLSSPFFSLTPLPLLFLV